MKKIIKGFTLVELIVVMAVFSILMIAIMQCFKPIRDTYVDSTFYESQRTAQNGIIKYVSESTRYATDIGIYTKTGGISNISVAVNEFANAYIAAHNITDATDIARARYNISKQAEVITIDNVPGAYRFGYKSYGGRVLRRKVDGSRVISSSDDTEGSGWSRLALGAGYYGKTDFTITLEPTEDYDAHGDRTDASIKINVASKFGNKGDPTKVVSVSGLVFCQNLTLKDVKSTFDISGYNDSAATQGKTYIVYLNDNDHVLDP